MPLLCGACGDVRMDGEPDCGCNAQCYALEPKEAAQMATARWQAVSLERIADSLEELITFKENEARERLGLKEH